MSPVDDVSTLRARRRAYKLLTEKGLIRVGLAVPGAGEFVVTAIDDPYGCSTKPETGSGILSMYRRPIPTTNIGFLSAIMWDGREPTLESQAVAATLVHAQAKNAPTPEQVAQIVAFQKGIFTAQIFDTRAKFLTGDNARGGPVALSSQEFYIGINDPLGLNPKGIPFTPEIFDLYRPWLNAGHRHDHDGLGTPMANVSELFRTVNVSDDWRHSDHGRSMVNEHRRSVARGEELFNKTRINITGVSGLNDELKVDSIPGFCTICHDSPNVGNHSVKAPLNIGVPDAGDKKPPALDISGLPVFTLKCTNVPDGDPLKNKVYKVTDPGRAMISGKCKDIGRFKGPILRGLAARAPFFHNGSAATLRRVLRPAVRNRVYPQGENRSRQFPEHALTSILIAKEMAGQTPGHFFESLKIRPQQAGGYHVFMLSKNSELLLVLRSLSSRKSIASIVPIGLRMRRSTYIFFRIAGSVSSSSLRVPERVMSIAGNVRLSATFRSRMSSELPVPLNSSKITSSMRLPVSISAVAMMVREPPSSMLRAAPKKRFGR